jgi:4-amino-4-deoxy-L-arabinose transferase-like glycosyltransferase
MSSANSPSAPIDSARWWRYALAIVGIGLILRAGWAIAIPILPISDAAVYDRLAQNLASGNGYGHRPGRPIAYWPPGAPLLFAGIYSLVGRNLAVVAAVQVVISTLIVALGLLAARRWFGDRASLWSGLILALWPGQIQYSTVMGTELPFEAALLGALLLWEQRGWRLALQGFGSGLLIGIGSLIRPTGVLLPVVLGLSRAVRERSLRSATTATLACLMGAALMIAPWTYRNYRTFGRFILISLNSGSNLWMGNHPDSDGGYEKIPERFRHLNEYERDRAMRAEAMASIRDNPIRFLKLGLHKIVGFHERETIGVVWNQRGIERRLGPASLNPLKRISTLYWYTALALGLIGCLILAARAGPVQTLFHPCIIIWLYFVAIHAVTVSFIDRYHFAVVPLVAALAGLTLQTLGDWLARTKRRAPSGGLTTPDSASLTGNGLGQA